LKKVKPNGFTLIELIVVLVIVGLLSGLVMPRVFGTLTHVELRSAARNTVSLLHQARDLAYYKKKYIKASFNLDTGHITISTWQSKTAEEKGSFADPEMDWVGMKDFFLADSVKLTKCAQKGRTVTQGLFDIIFYPAGNTDGGRITLMNKKGRTFIIKVNVITGNARILQENDGRV
jgi:prepilin-type N-terminal cleavage/methylation domain-containing protein